MKKNVIIMSLIASAVILSGCNKTPEVDGTPTDTGAVVDTGTTTTIPTENTGTVSAADCSAAVQAYLASANKDGSGDPIKAGDMIVVDYVGRLADGTVFDSSVLSVAQPCGKFTEGRDYNAGLEFTVGGGQMIKGFDQGVVDMKVGQTKTITIPAAQAYGERNSGFLIKVAKKDFPMFDQYSVGQEFVNQLGQRYIVYAKTDAEITFDANHPLAGKELIFDITVKMKKY